MERRYMTVFTQHHRLEIGWGKKRHTRHIIERHPIIVTSDFGKALDAIRTGEKHGYVPHGDEGAFEIFRIECDSVYSCPEAALEGRLTNICFRRSFILRPREKYEREAPQPKWTERWYSSELAKIHAPHVSFM